MVQLRSCILAEAFQVFIAAQPKDAGSPNRFSTLRLLQSERLYCITVQFYRNDGRRTSLRYGSVPALLANNESVLNCGLAGVLVARR